MYYLVDLDKMVETHSEIRQFFPNTSLPAELTDEYLNSINVFHVKMEEVIMDGLTSKVVYDKTPSLVNGVYVFKGNIVPLNLEELTDLKANKLQSIKMAVQGYLDSVARKKGYDSILSACSYAGGENPFQAESLLFLKWRGDVWAYLYNQLSLVETGEIQEPTIPELLTSMPQLIIDGVTLSSIQ